MSLRPRYSLLTLLVLTALVAGGVKLWYGPHHVVEEKAPGKQLEYTYTRNWQGKKIAQGLGIIRIYAPDQQGLYIVVSYFKNDQQIPCYYVLYKRGLNATSNGMTSGCDFDLLAKMPLSADEQQAFRAAIELERKKKDHDPGKGLVWFEYLGGLEMIPKNHVNEFYHFRGIYEYQLNIPWANLLDTSGDPNW